MAGTQIPNQRSILKRKKDYFRGRAFKAIKNAGIFKEPQVLLFDTIVFAEICPEKIAGGFGYGKLVHRTYHAPALKLDPTNDKKIAYIVHIRYSCDSGDVEINIGSAGSNVTGPSFHEDYKSISRVYDLSETFEKFIFRVLSVDCNGTPVTPIDEQQSETEPEFLKK